jgi:hypothetical protein
MGPVQKSFFWVFLWEAVGTVITWLSGFISSSSSWSLESWDSWRKQACSSHSRLVTAQFPVW